MIGSARRVLPALSLGLFALLVLLDPFDDDGKIILATLSLFWTNDW